MTASKKPASAEQLVTILQALSDPVRLELVRQLALEGEKACGSFGIDMPKSSMSHHFTILRKSGLLSYEKKGSLTMNRLERDRVESTFPGLLESVLSAAQGGVKRNKRTK